MTKREYRIELHCHTQESSPCSNVPAAELVRLYRESGYDGMLITDHFISWIDGEKGSVDWHAAVERFLMGYRAAKEAGDALGISVYLGAEIRFPGSNNDYLLIGLNETLLRENEWLYEMDLSAFYRFAKEHGVLVIQAHPYREGCTPAEPQYLDGIEVYNGHKGHESRNHLAKARAEEFGLIQTVGSDCHYEHAYSTAAVCLPILPLSEEELAACLKAGGYRMETDRR